MREEGYEAGKLSRCIDANVEFLKRKKKSESDEEGERERHRGRGGKAGDTRASRRRRRCYRYHWVETWWYFFGSKPA